MIANVVKKLYFEGTVPIQLCFTVGFKLSHVNVKESIIRKGFKYLQTLKTAASRTYAIAPVIVFSFLTALISTDSMNN